MPGSEPNDVTVTSRWRNVAFAVVAAAGLAIAASQLDGHYPVRQWLVWVYLKIWLLCAAWALACVSGGHAILRRIRCLTLPLREHLLFSFACGVLAFVLGLFLIGLFGGLGPVSFFGWPLLLFASGAMPLIRLGRRAFRRIRLARQRPSSIRSSPGASALLVFGAIGVLALYLNILTPANVAYDARWYHLGLAEQYAAAHSIHRFPEGWFPGALPQLASYLYTWAFLLPRSGLFTHIELAAHLEFVLFLATLASLPLLARWLLGGVRAPLSWTALFLFPGILIYDSTLSGAADHVLAFWAVPLFLASARFWRSWTRRDAGLLAAVAGGAALTKYQVLYLLVPIALGLAVKTVVLMWRGRSARPMTAPLVGGALFALITSIHWLKNLIWYGDPVYPLLHDHLKLRPWSLDADAVTTMQSAGFKPSGTFSHRLFESAEAMVTFAFQAHDWPAFHRDWPTFGFLFTLLLPFVVLFKGAWRLRALASASLVGVFVWFWTFHQDRYLQALVPWMAAVVAAVIWHLWRAGRVARFSVIPLVALQIIWGGDHYALPTHTMIYQQPMRLSMDLIASGFDGRAADRLAPPSTLVSVGKTLPRDARVLMHEDHLRLGIGVPSLTDAPGTQGALSYRWALSARDVWEKYRALGVTHLLWPASPLGHETFADEAVFYEFATRHLVAPPHTEGGVVVAALGDTPPVLQPYGEVALLGCDLAHRTTIPELDTQIWIPTPAPSPAQIVAIQKDADFIVLEARCRTRFPSVGGFDLLTSRSGWETWARHR